MERHAEAMKRQNRRIGRFFVAIASELDFLDGDASDFFFNNEGIEESWLHCTFFLRRSFDRLNRVKLSAMNADGPAPTLTNTRYIFLATP